MRQQTSAAIMRNPALTVNCGKSTGNTSTPPNSAMENSQFRVDSRAPYMMAMPAAIRLAKVAMEYPSSPSTEGSERTKYPHNTFENTRFGDPATTLP